MVFALYIWCISVDRPSKWLSFNFKMATRVVVGMFSEVDFVYSVKLQRNLLGMVLGAHTSFTGKLQTKLLSAVRIREGRE